MLPKTVIYGIGLFFGILASLAYIPSLPCTILMTKTDKHQRSSEALLLLMGGGPERLHKTAGIYHQKLTKKIIFARPESGPWQSEGLTAPVTERTRKGLEQLMVPPESIVILEHTRNTNTIEEAQALLHHLKKENIKSAVVTTSWYHIRRTKYVFNLLVPPEIHLSYAAATSDHRDFDTWWRHESIFLLLFIEYLKLAYYFVYY